MKTIARLIFALGLCLAFTLPMRASIWQVTHLTNSGSSVIITPGQDTKVITIQNNGSGDVRLSFDGGSGYVTPNSGKTGTNPTPTTGYLLKGGQTPADRIIISTYVYTGSGPDNTLHKPIVAELVTSTTTTIDISTDGLNDQFPTN